MKTNNYLFLLIWGFLCSTQQLTSQNNIVQSKFIENASIRIYNNFSLLPSSKSIFSKPEDILKFLLFTDVKDEKNQLIYNPKNKKKHSNNKLKFYGRKQGQITLDLQYRMTFQENAINYAFLKFYLLADGKIKSVKLWFFQKEKEQWYLIDTPERFIDAKHFFRNVKKNLLTDILKGKKGSDPIINEVIDNTRFNGDFDIDAYNILISRWFRSEEKHKIFHIQDDIKKLIMGDIKKK